MALFFRLLPIYNLKCLEIPFKAEFSLFLSSIISKKPQEHVKNTHTKTFSSEWVFKITIVWHGSF